MSVLTTRNLSKNYGKIKAVDKLDMNIEAGNVYGILGPNGSGKTTTLGLILGILQASQGEFEWFNGEFGDQTRKKIGSILETPNFYPYMNALDNLEIIRHIKGADVKADFDELLELVNLSHRKKSAFRTYSLGMKQRLAIAATLIGDPEVLIFDEPTNGLDPQGIAEVRNLLKRIAGMGKTVIMASHILDEVEKICSHVAIIKEGKLLAIGPVGAILSSDIFVEIASNDMAKLKIFLTELAWVKQIDRKNQHFECVIDQAIKVEDFNKAAFENGIILTHLVARKRKLEEEFLEITKES
jgi:ABC-2 type transport system ATP-binding protein